MGINVRIERGDRSLVDEGILDGGGHLARALAACWDLGSDDFPFATSIDPYGDTLLNYLQAGRLAEELERIIAASATPSPALGALRDLARRVAGGGAERLYLVFLGD